MLAGGLVFSPVVAGAQKYRSHSVASPMRDDVSRVPFIEKSAGDRGLDFVAAQQGGGQGSGPGSGENSPSRLANREKLSKVLDRSGSLLNTTFRRSTKQPFNFVGIMNTGLANSESLEIVIGVTNSETIGFRVYPHYGGGYVNIDKSKNHVGLMRKLLQLSDTGFFYWGTDPSNDVFAGYTFTLESGFPEDALIIVLRSIPNLDKFVGELRPFVDGSIAPPAKPAPTSNF